MLLLSCQQIKKYFGVEEVLKGISFDIQHNERIGLIGSNGAGKSTLAAIIEGKIEADEGCLKSLGRSLNISVYNQDKAEQEFKTSGKSALSGGEKAKSSLVKVLNQQSSLLILDEPTNNLDLTGITWLIREIEHYPGAILIISHDRYFLDQTVKRIMFLEAGLLKIYEGNYSFFREEKRRQDQAARHQYLEEQKRQKAVQTEISRLENWSTKAHRESMQKARDTGGKKEYFRAKAKKTDKKIKSKLKMLDRLQKTELEKPRGEQHLNLDFLDGAGHGRRIMEALEISKAYGRKKLFTAASFYVMRGEKVGIFGANGSGKTTLLKCIMGQENLDQGDIWLSQSAKWVYFHQDFLELPEEYTPMQYLAEGDQKADQIQVLAGLGLYGEMLREPIAQLSLGQRTRLKLAKILLQDCNLLLLDEPTNHLDILSREILEEALLQYKGTIVLVTHDRYLLNNVCNRLLVLEEGSLKRIETGDCTLKARSGEASGERAQERDQQKMLLELRLTWLLSQIAGLASDDPAYQDLDQEFKHLIQIKRELNGASN